MTRWLNVLSHHNNHLIYLLCTVNIKSDFVYSHKAMRLLCARDQIVNFQNLRVSNDGNVLSHHSGVRHMQGQKWFLLRDVKESLWEPLPCPSVFLAALWCSLAAVVYLNCSLRGLLCGVLPNYMYESTLSFLTRIPIIVGWRPNHL